MWLISKYKNWCANQKWMKVKTETSCKICIKCDRKIGETACCWHLLVGGVEIMSSDYKNLEELIKTAAKLENNYIKSLQNETN